MLYYIVVLCEKTKHFYVISFFQTKVGLMHFLRRTLFKINSNVTYKNNLIHIYKSNIIYFVYFFIFVSILFTYKLFDIKMFNDLQEYTFMYMQHQ